MIILNSFFRKINVVFILSVFLMAASCASGQIPDGNIKGTGKTQNKENTGINVKKSVNNYNDLLVNIKSYSTNGGYYQKKYEKLLISMAGDLTEGRNLEVTRESIGFYYDKRSQRTDRLFFGVDINTQSERNLDYGRFSVKLIKENVSGIIDLMYKYKAILDENEIVGIVIGFKWAENGGTQQVNIWIKKEDLHLFYEEKITLNEMFQRSTITNSTGKIILLPI